jgi:putative PIN family toxin of toxin-antitoxin system
MNISKKNRVFFDSSVIIAGLASPNGASSVLLGLSEMGLIIPVISEKVVMEVIRNIEKKLPNYVTHFYRLFKVMPFILVEPTEKNIKVAGKIINEKDSVILAAAMSSEIDYLVSLDKHFLSIQCKTLSFKVCTPSKVVRDVYIENH